MTEAPAPKAEDLPLDVVLSIAAHEAGASLAQIAGPTRNATLDRARQVAIYVARTYGGGATTTAIGRVLKRHRTSVLYSIAQMRKRMEVDEGLRATCERILAMLAEHERSQPAPAPPADTKSPEPEPKSAPAAPTRRAVVTRPRPNRDAQLPVELYTENKGASRDQRAYLQHQDEAFVRAMREAGYAGPEAHSGR